MSIEVKDYFSIFHDYFEIWLVERWICHDKIVLMVERLNVQPHIAITTGYKFKCIRWIYRMALFAMACCGYQFQILLIVYILKHHYIMLNCAISILFYLFITHSNYHSVLDCDVELSICMFAQLSNLNIVSVNSCRQYESQWKLNKEKTE